MLKKKLTVKTDRSNVTIKIEGGEIKITRDFNPPDPKAAEDKSLAIWRNHSAYRSGDRTIRSGNGLCGVFKNFNPDYPFIDDYIEVDTIHSASCIDLALNIFEFYPDLFTPTEQLRIITFLKDHDLGESERGDNADDGSLDHDKKFEIEFADFVKKIEYHTLELQDILIRDFVMFENADLEEWPKRDREIFQFAKLVDKTDALLSSFIYEKQWRKGSLLYKKEHYGGITDQDQRYSDLTREYSQAAIWSAHMIDHYKEYNFLKIFVDIVAAACRDTRKIVFPWLWELLTRFDIFTAEEREQYAR